jgi:hypothetical protein
VHDDPDLLAESKRLCRELEQFLPSKHTPPRIATLDSIHGHHTIKLPSKIAGALGALCWRAHDFATLACELFERQRVVPGATMARALMETTALVFLLHKKMSTAILQRDVAPLDDFLVRCLAGNRLDSGDPKALNVLTAIQALDKEPGAERYEEFYAVLCEFTHPNALGTFYAYAEFDNATRRISFGHNRGFSKGEDIAFAVVFALEVMIAFIARIQVCTPTLVALAKDLYADHDPT